MIEEPKILWTLDEDTIRWQYCAICGEQKQRVVRQDRRPDYAICDHCRSAFLLEEGGGMRMLYGDIPNDMPATRQFALKQWQRYFDIRTVAQKERAAINSDNIPEPLQKLLDDNKVVDPQEEILSLEAQKSDIFYSRAKKLEKPPRRLRETGELPDLDQLFQDLD